MFAFSPALIRQVAQRAGYRCEYCHTPQEVTAQAFHLDHIIPRARGGPTNLDNLCYACPRCNLHKSNQVEASDPRTRRVTRLFNPRTDRWPDHFRWSPTYQRIVGRTAIGRTTLTLLDFNAPILVKARQLWLVLALIP